MYLLNCIFRNTKGVKFYYRDVAISTNVKVMYTVSTIVKVMYTISTIHMHNWLNEFSSRLILESL